MSFQARSTMALVRSKSGDWGRSWCSRASGDILKLLLIFLVYVHMDNCQWNLWLNNGISCLISFFTGDAATLAMCPVDGLVESWLTWTWTGVKYVDKKLAAGCCFPIQDQPFIVLQPSSFPACQGCQGRFYAHGWDQNCIVKSIYFIEISLIEGEIKIAGPENVKM